MPPDLILASASKVRARLLKQAGVPFQVQPANVDEEEIKRALISERAPAREIAEVLAELKATRMSSRNLGSFVLGADQVLECDGRLFDKPISRMDVCAHLEFLQGKTHTLNTAMVVAQDGNPIWRNIETSRLTMRPLDGTFIEQYTDRNAECLGQSVGAYFLEEEGVQLFSKIDGDFFSILGLSLLPLLDFLRRYNIVST